MTATTTLTIEQANQIREAWYIMDGPSDRPHTIPDCHAMIEQLLGLVGEITGITNAGVISPLEPAAADDPTECARAHPGQTHDECADKSNDPRYRRTP